MFSVDDIIAMTVYPAWVLILVLLEDVLSVIAKVLHYIVNTVLILVLLEDVLSDVYLIYFQLLLLSLNPCFIGRCSQW